MALSLSEMELMEGRARLWNDQEFRYKHIKFAKAIQIAMLSVE